MCIYSTQAQIHNHAHNSLISFRAINDRELQQFRNIDHEKLGRLTRRRTDIRKLDRYLFIRAVVQFISFLRPPLNAYVVMNGKAVILLFTRVVVLAELRNDQFARISIIFLVYFVIPLAVSRSRAQRALMLLDLSLQVDLFVEVTFVDHCSWAILCGDLSAVLCTYRSFRL